MFLRELTLIMLRNVGRDTAAAVVVAAQALTQAAQTTTTTIAINIYTT